MNNIKNMNNDINSTTMEPTGFSTAAPPAFCASRCDSLVALVASSAWEVNIPAQTLHGIEAGSEGCEFLWMFPGQRWKDRDSTGSWWFMTRDVR